MATFNGMTGDVFWGDPEKPEPDWRDQKDPDDRISDDDDPKPIGRNFLIASLGFDPSENDDDEDD